MQKRGDFSQLNSFISRQDDVVLAYVFGSHASGRTTPMSDLDLALLLDSSVHPDNYFDFRMAFRSRKGFPPAGTELDIVILNEAPPLLAYEILKKGKLIYCRNKHQLVTYTARAVTKYLDTKHLRKVQFEAVSKRIKGGHFGHLKGSNPVSIEKIRALSSKIKAAPKNK